MYSPTSRLIIPVRIRTVGRFRGTNPWKGATLAEWSIEEYRMVEERYAGAVVTNPTGKWAKFVAARGEALGIRAETDGTHHLLPGLLAELWWSKEVGDIELPHLIHAIEAEMGPADYLPRYGAGTSKALQYGWSGTHAAIGFALFELYVYYASGHLEQYQRDNALVLLWGSILFTLMGVGYFLFFARRRKRFLQRNARIESRLRELCTRKPGGR